MSDHCHRGPTQCPLCGDWTQRPEHHEQREHATRDGDVLPPRLAMPMTHPPVLNVMGVICLCGRPTVHHVHGYDMDCSCPEGDCRPLVPEGPERKPPWWKGRWRS
jgi:hypothetical protein